MLVKIFHTKLFYPYGCLRSIIGTLRSATRSARRRALKQRHLSYKTKTKARFKRRILHVPNAIETMHNDIAYLIIYCLAFLIQRQITNSYVFCAT